MFFSVIVPVHNGGEQLEDSLQALASSRFSDWELVVVDDGSVDDSVSIAKRFDARVFETGARSGPAAARNQGAREAHGEYLFFVDADCAVHAEALSLAAQHLNADPSLEALFGSYDDEPEGKGLISQYKNLQHHFVHQNGDEKAETFWSGCGAIRRLTFLELGGFDEVRYRRPSVEDIELGYRLRASGGRILLAKNVQVKHLKKWSLGRLLMSEFSDRGLPWAELLFRRTRSGGRELNLSLKSRLSVLATALASLALALSVLRPVFLAGAALASLFVLTLNFDFYRFLGNKRGVWFAVRSTPLHIVHYAIGGAAFLSSAVATVSRFSAARVRGQAAPAGQYAEVERQPLASSPDHGPDAHNRCLGFRGQGDG